MTAHDIQPLEPMGSCTLLHRYNAASTYTMGRLDKKHSHTCNRYNKGSPSGSHVKENQIKHRAVFEGGRKEKKVKAQPALLPYGSA